MPLLGFPILLKQRWLECGLGGRGKDAEAILTWRMQKVPKKPIDSEPAGVIVCTTARDIHRS